MIFSFAAPSRDRQRTLAAASLKTGGKGEGTVHQSAATKPGNIPRDVEAFLQHWKKVARTGLVPTLADFLDAPPFKLQSVVAIVDVVSSTELRFRLFGTGLSTMAGVDLTGTDVLSNFHPTARAEASRIAWTGVSRPCGYLLRRGMRRGVIETTAVGIGLPLLHESSGRVGLVGFRSVLEKSVDVAESGESPFVKAFNLIRWIDIGAGIPDT